MGLLDPPSLAPLTRGRAREPVCKQHSCRAMWRALTGGRERSAIDRDLLRRLALVVGEAHVQADAARLVPYSYDATARFQHMPDAVVRPGSRDEVAGILQVLSKAGVPAVPRGSGSGLSAGAVPIQGGVVIEMNRLDALEEVDQENLTATFGPGLVTSVLSRALEPMGLLYPPDPGSTVVSSLGGNVAECAGGMRALKYGVTRDYVIGLEAVLASGEVIRTGGKSSKDVAGYDLTRLLVGSEGTLAVITRITVRLVPMPEDKGTALAVFEDLAGAARAVSRIIAARIVPATLEFLDHTTIRVVEAFTKAGLPTDAGAILLMQQDGPREAVVRDLERMVAICREAGASQVRRAADAAEGDRLMAARRATLPALARLRPTTILEDATVPRSRLAEMVSLVEAIAKRHQVTMATFGHAGDGNLHPTALTDTRDTEELERVEAAFDEIFRAALDLGGTITGEHGVGLAKAAYMEERFGPATLDLMRRIKAAWDPAGILNPGKMFPHESRRQVVIERDDRTGITDRGGDL